MPQCDFCEKKAVVHELEVVKGERIKRHLCEVHGKDRMVKRPKPFVEQVREMAKHLDDLEI